MYYPYFRGKQYELIAIKEQASLIASSSILPIIEPVKKNLAPLKRTVEALKENEAQFIIVVNPKYGELVNDPLPLFEDLIDNYLSEYDKVFLGYIVDAKSALLDIKDFVETYEDFSIALIHNGFPKGKHLKEAINGSSNIKKHIFIEGFSGKLYQKNFEDVDRILLRDGFERRRNADHPDVEHFSDLHITYEDEGMDGFGDFLMVGDDYNEAGGPAYTVALHITYLDDEEDMFIYHFKSDTTDTPVDPAGKFFEALFKLDEEIKEGSSICETSACGEFIELFNKGHFPGLGYVKKLSMTHHLELMADYFMNS